MRARGAGRQQRSMKPWRRRVGVWRTLSVQPRQWVDDAFCGAKSANDFGRDDMHGDAWEWVQDVAHENYQVLLRSIFRLNDGV